MSRHPPRPGCVVQSFFSLVKPGLTARTAPPQPACARSRSARLARRAARARDTVALDMGTLVSVPKLRPPALDVYSSFLQAMSEFQTEGRGAPDDDSMIGREIRDGGWHSVEGFADFLARLRADADADPATPRLDGRVPCTTWWWCEGSTYLGRIAVRHRLTERLLRIGGHVGYDVRPTARRQGHATAMLGAVLPYARDLGIDRALLTCDVDNLASRRVIEANGGVLEVDDQGTLRYWISTMNDSRRPKR